MSDNPYRYLSLNEPREYQFLTEATAIEKVKNDLGLPGKYVFWKKWSNWGDGQFKVLATEVSGIMKGIIDALPDEFYKITQNNEDLAALPLADRIPIAAELLIAQTQAMLSTKLLKYPDLDSLAERYQGKTYGIPKYS